VSLGLRPHTTYTTGKDHRSYTSLPHVTIRILLILQVRLTDSTPNCPHTTICVLILLNICPRTTHTTGKAHRSYTSLSSYYFMCPHTIICVLTNMCVLILLYACSYYSYTKVRLTDPTRRCPHTIYVSSYYSICALNDECFCAYFGFSGATILLICMRPQYVAASYSYACVLILLYN
jgi:hypothetical protein